MEPEVPPGSAPAASFVGLSTPAQKFEHVLVRRFDHPAQRAGRAKPRAEAAGRCPGERDDKPARPEGPRESLPEPWPVQRGSRGPSGRTDLGPISQGIGLRPQPWAGFYRPVRPGGCLSPYVLVFMVASTKRTMNGVEDAHSAPY